MTTGGRLAWILMLFGSGAATAQEGAASAAFEARMLDILEARGVVEADEADELRPAARAGALLGRGERARFAALEEQISALDPPAGAEKVRLRHRGRNGWRLNVRGEDFRLDWGMRLQTRFSYDFFSTNAATGGENRPDFDVARARITFEGRAFRDWMRFELSLEVAGQAADTPVAFGPFDFGSSSENLLVEASDVYLQFAFDRAFHVYLGQFKVPYSRQYLTSSGQLQFVDRSILRSEFVPGRSAGILASGSIGDRDGFLAEYAAGIFNGERHNSRNDDKGLLYAGRLGIHPAGELPYSESVLRGLEGLRFALGLNGWYHQDDNHSSERDDWSVGADFGAVWGPVSLLAEIHYHERGRARTDRRAVGWLVQGGVMLVPGTFEIALRGAELSWDGSGSDAARREYLLGLNWYMEGHDLKVQLDFGRVEAHFHNHDRNRDGWRLRLQIQANF